jgi:hypothetical protein
MRNLVLSLIKTLNINSSIIVFYSHFDLIFPFLMCAQHNNRLLPSSKLTNYLKEGENIEAFRNQLRRHNLKLRNIIGDGNCLFRSCKFIFVLFLI